MVHTSNKSALFPQAPANSAALSVYLWSGGDERLSFDPKTGRNLYGIPAKPAPDEAFFASSTASPVTARGFSHAARAYEGITRDRAPLALTDWFDALRSRLLALFGSPDDEVIFAPSGTDSELLALTLAQSGFSRPVANVLVAPQEIGRGVMLAADGRHFLNSSPFAPRVTRGARLEGLEHSDVRVDVVELRDGAGLPIDAADVDALVAQNVEAHLAAGRDVLLHLLDCSKTGLSGPTRAAAAALCADNPGRVQVVVDSCQLRGDRAQVRADLEAGFWVQITGSKFAGGPPFAGALMIPASAVARMTNIAWPAALSAHSAALDWSARLRSRVDGSFSAHANIGLGLRWECALAELERYFSIGGAVRRRVARTFSETARLELAQSPGLKLVDPDFGRRAEARTILPILTFDDHGRDIPADALLARMRAPRDGRRVFHLGQPVQIGARTALRLCLGAPLVNAVADRMDAGEEFAAAVQPLVANMREVFGLWRALVSSPDPVR